MLFEFKSSRRRLYSMLVSILINVAVFIAFEFYFTETNFSGISILFLASAVTNSILFILNFRKTEQFSFYENEILVSSLNEDKTLRHLNLLYFDRFFPNKQRNEVIHLITDIGQFTFREQDDDTYYEVGDYLEKYSKPALKAKYEYYLLELKKRLPSMFIGLIFLLSYVYYLTPYFSNINTFIKIIIGVQIISLLFFIGQWFYYKNKLK